MNKKNIKPIILIILDGWGYSINKKGNAIYLAKTPTMDMLWQNYPHSLLNASGQEVGLPKQQVGNSEVGHTTIGAGRVINQDLVKISKSIKTQNFFKNITIHKIYQHSVNYTSKIHLIGLCSNGGVHSHIKHLQALIQISKEYNILTCLHLILDGRDTNMKEAKTFIKEIICIINNSNNIKICTISGRYYSMDRDCRWSRTEKAYNVLINNHIDLNNKIDILSIIDQYYKNNIYDEFIPPTRICKGNIANNDSIIFFNFRPDRIRQLLHTFAKPDFKGFKTKNIHNLMIGTFTEYDSNLSLPTIFPPTTHQNFLGQIISYEGLKQLRLAETEKYAHVTYFFNGGIEEPFPGENRILIPSPKVDTYDSTPEMSANKLTDSLIQAIKLQTYDLIVINYANPDMIGHTGNLKATIAAVEMIDQCIKKILETTKSTDYTIIITADHGNADYMLTENNTPCTSHSLNPVPFILINNDRNNKQELKKDGNLADIAPTILNLLNIDIPNEMNGTSLLTHKNTVSITHEYK
uniref:2,3-bisphosphoglycerate-independent phosphoglycerate mutase n=1 Tax=Campylaephora sungminbooi TaxID=1896769 RepID=A0A1B0RRV0_9FLOR|nr:phosphoglycerate mutase [Campylaephora sungminbooi]AKU47506.1 phosphoglycerate mutase [Campylaephora sungminbooi]